jgi:hypothetical protein
MSCAAVDRLQPELIRQRRWATRTADIVDAICRAVCADILSGFAASVGALTSRRHVRELTRWTEADLDTLLSVPPSRTHSFERKPVP